MSTGNNRRGNRHNNKIVNKNDNHERPLLIIKLSINPTTRIEAISTVNMLGAFSISPARILSAIVADLTREPVTAESRANPANRRGSALKHNFIRKTDRSILPERISPAE